MGLSLERGESYHWDPVKWDLGFERLVLRVGLLLRW